MTAGRRQRGTKCAHLLGPCEFPGGEFTIDRKRTIRLGQERVLTAGPRELPLGEAEDEDGIKIQADPGGDGAESDALPVPAGTPERCAEIVGDDRCECRERRVRLDRIERSTTSEDRTDCSAGLDLALRPARCTRGVQELVEHRPCAVHSLRPAARRLQAGQTGSQIADEGVERACRLRLTAHALLAPDSGRGAVHSLLVQFRSVSKQSHVPVVAVHDAGAPRDPVPAVDRHRPSVRGPDRPTREEREQFVTREPCADEREDPIEETARNRVDQRSNVGTVRGDSGRVELRDHGSRVGLDRRRQDRHAVQTNAGSGEFEDPAHHRAHLLVDIGRGHDLGAGDQLHRLGRRDDDAESSRGREDRRVSQRIAGAGQVDGRRTSSQYGPQDCGETRWERLEQVDDDRPRARSTAGSSSATAAKAASTTTFSSATPSSRRRTSSYSSTSALARGEPSATRRARVCGATRDSSTNRRANARSVAAWLATGAKNPGAVASWTRIAASNADSVRVG